MEFPVEKRSYKARARISFWFLVSGVWLARNAKKKRRQ